MRDINIQGLMNITHYSIVDRMEYINDKYGENAYNQYVKDIGSYIDIVNTYQNDDSVLHFDNIGSKRENLQKQINTIDDAMNGKIKEILGFDVEVIGDIRMPETFAVTEVGFSSLNKNGIQDLEQYSMNLPVTVSTDIKDLNEKTHNIKQSAIDYFDGKDMSEIEEAANNVTVNNRLEYNLGETLDRNITEQDIRNSIDNINIKAGITGKSDKKIISQQEQIREKLINMHDYLLDAVNNETPIFGHNMKNADIPWINQLFKENGLSQIDFSKTTVIDTFELIQNTISDKMYEMYSNAGLSSKEHMQSLESIEELLGIQDTLSHVATNDINANFKILNTPLKDGSTLFENIKNSINEKNEPAKRNGLLYSYKAIANNDKSLTISVDSNGNPETYKSYATGKGSYYTIDSLKYISPEEYKELSKQMPSMKEKLTGNEGYVLKLNTYGGTHNEELLPSSTYIFGNSIGEINESLSDHFIQSKRGKNVDEEIASRYKDLARRKFNNFFEQNANSFVEANEYYSSYNMLKEYGIDSKEKVKELFTTGSVNANDKTYKLKDLFIGDYKYFLKSDSKKRNFYYMYETLTDTAETVTPIIKEINEKFPKAYENNPEVKVNFDKEKYIEKYVSEHYGKDMTYDKLSDEDKNIVNRAELNEYWATVNQRKASVLATTMEKVENEIEDKNGSIYFEETKYQYDNDFNKTYGTLNINGEDVMINMATEQSTFEGISRKIYSNKDGSSPVKTNNLRKEAFKDFVFNLKEKGLISEESFSNYYNTADIYSAMKDVSRQLYEIKASDPKSIKAKDISIFDDGMKVKYNPIEDSDNYTISELINNEDMSLSEYIKTFVTDDISKFAKDKTDIAINNLKDIKTSFIIPYINTYSEEDKIQSKIYDDYIKDTFKGLFKELGYNDKEQTRVAEAINGRETSYMNRGYHTVLTGYYNNNGDREFAIIAFNDKNKERTMNQLHKGEMPDRALIHKLVPVDTDMQELRTIKTGDVKHLITNNISSFYDKKGNLVTYLGDTVTSSISGATNYYKSIDKMYEQGNIKGANQLINRGINKAISEAPGASSFQTLIENEYSKSKEFIPRMIDLQKLTNLDGLLNYLPAFMNTKNPVYQAAQKEIDEEEFKAVTNYIYKSGINKENITLEKLRSKSNQFVEWLAQNTFEGANVLDNMKELVENQIISSNGNPRKNKLYMELESISKGHKEGVFGIGEDPNMILSPTKFDSWTINNTDFYQMTPYSFLNPSRRTQKYQNLNSIPLINKEIEDNLKNLDIGVSTLEEYKEYLRKGKLGTLGIELGDNVRTKYANNRYFIPMENKYKGGFTLNIYAGIKQMTSSQMYDKITYFEENKVDNITKSLMDDELVQATGYNTETVKAIVGDFLNQYKSSGMTNEQHSFINPILSQGLYFKQDLKSVKVDSNVIQSLIDNGNISKGDIIGSYIKNGKERYKLYDGDDGKIVNYNLDKGVIYIDKNEKVFDAVKVFIGDTEKTVASTVAYSNITGKYETEIATKLYQALYGDITGIVGNYNILGHESGSLLVGSVLNITTQTVLNSSNEKEGEKIVSLLNKNFGYGYEIENYKSEKFFTMVNPHDRSSTENIFRQYENFIEDLNNIADDNQLAKEILTNLKTFDDNDMLYSTIKQAFLNQSYRYAEDKGINGNKISERGESILGQFYEGLESIKIDENGNVHRISENILKYHKGLLKNNPTYKEAMFDIASIVDAGTAEMIHAKTGSVTNGAVKGKITELNIDDILTRYGDNLNTDTLQKTLFGKYKDTSVFKINLGDTYVLNPFKAAKIANETYNGNIKKMNEKIDDILKSEEAMDNTIYLPNSRPLVIDDDTMFLSESMKKETKVIDALLELKDPQSFRKKGISKQDQINKVNEYILDYYNGINDEIINKNGIVSKKLLSGTLPFSMRDLDSGVVKFNFIDGSKTKIKNGFSDKFIKIDTDGNLMYESTEIYNKNDFRKKFHLTDETITEQILHERLGEKDYKKLINKDSTLLDELKSRNLLNDKYGLNIMSKEEWINNEAKNIGVSVENFKKLNDVDYNYENYYNYSKRKLEEQISDYYTENIGIKGLSSRDPLFQSGGTHAVRTYTSKNVERNTVIMDEAQAAAKNADIDADTNATELFLYKDKKGRTKIISDNAEIMKDWQLMQNVQMKRNSAYYNDKNRSLEKEPVTSLKEYEKNFNKLHPNAKSTTLDIDVSDLFAGVKSSTEKKNIGYISNINKTVRDYNDVLAYYDLNNVSGNIAEMQKILDNSKKIIDFTKITEQKLIDVKHGAEKNKTIAGKYSKTLNNLFSEKSINDEEFAKKNIGDLIDTIKMSSIYAEEDKPLITLENVFNKGNDKNLTEGAKNAIEQLRSLYKLSQNKNIDVLIKNPISQNRNNIFNTEDVLNYLNNNRKDIMTDTIKNRVEAINSARDNKLFDNMFITDDIEDKILISKNNNILKILKIDDNSTIGKHVVLKDIINNKNKVYSGNSYLNIGKQLIDEGYSLENINNLSDDILKSIKDMKTDNDIKNIMSSPSKLKKEANLLELVDYINNGNLTEYENIHGKKETTNILNKYANLNDNEVNTLNKMLEYEDTIGKDTISDILNVNYAINKNKELTKHDKTSVIDSLNNAIIEKAKNKEKININSEYETIVRDIKNNKDSINNLLSDVTELKTAVPTNIITSQVLENRNKILGEIGQYNLNAEDYKYMENFINKEHGDWYKNLLETNKENITNNELYYYKQFVNDKSALNWYNNTKTAQELGKAKIGFGEYARYNIEDLSLEQLNNLLTEKKKYNVIINNSNKKINIDISNMVSESKDRIRAFVKAVNSDNSNYNNYSMNPSSSSYGMKINVDELNKNIIKKAEQKKNERIMNEAKERINKTTEKIAEEEAGKVGEGFFSKKGTKIALGVAGGILGLSVLANLGSKQLNKVNVQDANDDKEKRRKRNNNEKVFDAPSSNPVTYMDNGVDINISGNADGRIDTDDMNNNIGTAISGTTGEQVNLNVNQSDDREDVDKSWLKRKFSSMIN